MKTGLAIKTHIDKIDKSAFVLHSFLPSLSVWSVKEIFTGREIFNFLQFLFKNPIIARSFAFLTGSLPEEKSLKDFVREVLSYEEGIS